MSTEEISLFFDNILDKLCIYNQFLSFSYLFYKYFYK